MINNMWTDVALWFGLNAAIAAWCLYLLWPQVPAVATDRARS